MRNVETHLYEVQRKIDALGCDTSTYPERESGRPWAWYHVHQAETRLEGIQELQQARELLNQ